MSPLDCLLRLGVRLLARELVVPPCLEADTEMSSPIRWTLKTPPASFVKHRMAHVVWAKWQVQSSRSRVKPLTPPSAKGLKSALAAASLPIPPTTDELLANVQGREPKPLAFVVAGHNGSGKSTLWYERLAGKLQMPLVNADRLTMSILPEATEAKPLPDWARELRDHDDRWQRLSQAGVKLFRELIMDQKIPFAYETVFSYWEQQHDGSHASKLEDKGFKRHRVVSYDNADEIRAMYHLVNTKHTDSTTRLSGAM